MTTKHNVLETGSGSVFRRGERDTYSVGSLRHYLSQWGPVSETLCFFYLELWTMDKAHKRCDSGLNSSGTAWSWLAKWVWEF
jgi:hypothetical protein